MPGPGAYSLVVKHNKCLSFPKKLRFSPSETTLRSPGPGFYKTEIHCSSPGNSFSKAKRVFSEEKPTPGPGYYKGERPLGKLKGGVIARGAVHLLKQPQSPGPGAYLDVSITKTKDKSISIV